MQGIMKGQPDDDGDPLDGGEAHARVGLVEELADEAAEHVCAAWQRHAVQQHWHTHRADVRMARVAHVPQAVTHTPRYYQA
jgi:hypothetical protein